MLFSELKEQTKNRCVFFKVEHLGGVYMMPAANPVTGLRCVVLISEFSLTEGATTCDFRDWDGEVEELTCLSVVIGFKQDNPSAREILERHEKDTKS